MLKCVEEMRRMLNSMILNIKINAKLTEHWFNSCRICSFVTIRLFVGKFYKLETIGSAYDFVLVRFLCIFPFHVLYI